MCRIIGGPSCVYLQPVFKEETFPRTWKITACVHIYKSGNKTYIEGYALFAYQQRYLSKCYTPKVILMIENLLQ